MDTYGNAWAVWRQALQDYDPCGDIYYSVNTGTSWSEPAPVNEHPAVDRYPDIAVDGEGRIWCVWSSNREGENEWDYSVYASYFVGAGIDEELPESESKLSLAVEPGVGQSFTFRIPPLVGQGELIIYDASGRVVRDLTISNSQNVRWDGTDNKGQTLPQGVYFTRLPPNTSPLKLVLIR